MGRISPSTPLTQDINKSSCSQFFSSFFKDNRMRLLIVENRGKGQLTLVPVKVHPHVAQTCWKIVLLFTGVVPLFAAIWALCRFIHVKRVSKNWTIYTNAQELPAHLKNSSVLPPNFFKKSSNTELPLKKHAGIVNQQLLCWFNSELQVIAHFKHLRTLFSPQETPLKQREDETKAEFDLRQQIQQKGFNLITLILNGNNNQPIPATVIHEFGQLVFEAKLPDGNYLISRNPFRPKANIFGASQKAFLPEKFITYLKGEQNNHTLQLFMFDSLKDCYEQYQERNTGAPKQIICLINQVNIGKPVPSEITLPTGQTYVLQAVARGGNGHAIAYVRDTDGLFVQFDDRSVKKTGLKELKTHTNSEYYYLPKD